MSKILITGGLGQIGLGIAEKAIQLGHSVTLAGRSPLTKRPNMYEQFSRKEGLAYVEIDIYDNNSQRQLIALAGTHTWWINCAEPYKDEGPLGWEANANSLYATASDAGYTSGNSDGKKMIRIGSPPVEIWNDNEFEKRFGSGYPEDQPYDNRLHGKQGSQGVYFRAKRSFRQAAMKAYEGGLAILTVAPTLIAGPWSNHGDNFEVWLKVIRRDPPFNFMLPSDEGNVAILSKVAEGVLLAAQKGMPGHTYQLAGLNIPIDQVLKAYISAAEALPLRSGETERAQFYAAKNPVSISSPFPQLTFMWAELGARVLDFAKIEKPWWLNPDLFAMGTAMGKRSSCKAQDQLGYKPGTWADMESEIKKAIAWYREAGLY